ncbi:MAG: pyridoxal-phosphate dependent enzyme [Chitinophagaceae bacterium]
MKPIDFHSISLDPLFFNYSCNNDVDFFILRLDKMHDEISGNKWFKLRYYVDDAIAQHKQTIITFGGAWSNHLLATAAYCQSKNLTAVGIVRGEKPAYLSYTLKRAGELGMKLFFVSRNDFQEKIMPAELKAISDDAYIIDEGGYGMKGTDGAATISRYYKENEFSHICCAVGTGTMVAGLIKASTPQQTITGFSVLKNNRSIEKEITTLLTNEKINNHSIIHDYHFGGYAKKNHLLIEFMNRFYSETSIPTDFVYTAKMVYGVFDLANKNFFAPGSRVLLIHSGGLQGNNSLPQGTLIF